MLTHILFWFFLLGMSVEQNLYFHNSYFWSFPESDAELVANTIDILALIRYVIFINDLGKFETIKDIVKIIIRN